jgi:hypothetical protein
MSGNATDSNFDGDIVWCVPISTARRPRLPSTWRKRRSSESRAVGEQQVLETSGALDSYGHAFGADGFVESLLAASGIIQGQAVDAEHKVTGIKPKARARGCVASRIDAVAALHFADARLAI